MLLEWRLLGCAALVSGILVACGPGSESGSTPPSAPEASPAAASGSQASDAAQVSAAATAEAEQIFATRCYTCHGSAGAGDGPASASLTPTPRDFQDPAWQESVSDEHIEQIIQYGGAAVGRSPAMPGNPDLTAKPEVVAALRAYVRGLAPR